MPSTKFLFWNINRKPLAQLIADAVQEHQVEVLILAECEIEPAAMLWALNHASSRFHLTSGLCPSIVIYTGFPAVFVKKGDETNRISFRSIELPARDPILLAAVHLPSKLHRRDGSQDFEFAELARRIEAEEKRLGHDRTILVGDFNANPFEDAMVGGLHSVMSRQIAAKKTRLLQGREYPFFYNPMWAHYGDATSDTAASYFYDASEHVNHYWNMYDQVLIRPQLASRFESSSLSIVKRIGTRSLVHANGKPDRVVASDHLPLLFAVEF